VIRSFFRSSGSRFQSADVAAPALFVQHDRCGIRPCSAKRERLAGILVPFNSASGSLSIRGTGRSSIATVRGDITRHHNLIINNDNLQQLRRLKWPILQRKEACPPT
jgi:hypothetical protein